MDSKFECLEEGYLTKNSYFCCCESQTLHRTASSRRLSFLDFDYQIEVNISYLNRKLFDLVHV